jgi:hypothetical protein
MPKVKKFCRITKFLEQTDKSLFQVLDDLCLLGLFRVRGNGVTFLYPADAAYRKKIVTAAYSNSPEKAIDMVKALIIKDFLPGAASFKSKHDDIPNMLHQKTEVDVAKSTDKTVVLKSGHKLELDSSYVPIRRDDPVAVYKMTGKGELPTSGPKSMGKYMQKKTGGAPSMPEDTAERVVAKCVERTYASGNKEVYKAVMSALYKFVADKPEKNLVLNRMCASARASFYNIFSPYSLEKDYTISSLIGMPGLNNWKNVT